MHGIDAFTEFIQSFLKFRLALLEIVSTTTTPACMGFPDIYFCDIRLGPVCFFENFFQGYHCLFLVVRYAYIIANRYQFAKVFLGNNSKIIFWIFFFANVWEFDIIFPKIYEQAVNSWPGSPDIL
jgi:hypothetical protein